MSALPLSVASIRATEDRALTAQIVEFHALEGVTAGSALLRIGARLLAVHDDAFRVTWIDPARFGLTPLVLRGEGRALPKSRKPDFEAAVRTEEGDVYLLGSGSTSRRCTFARIDLDSGVVALQDRAEVYRCVQDALELKTRSNIEGAIVRGERLSLFHRGSGGAPSASVDVPIGVLDGAAPRALAAQTFDLGELEGVRLGFTDAVSVSAHRAIFAAAAEDTPDAIADGPVAGSVLGIFEDPASARFTRLIAPDGGPCRSKVEGLAVDDDLRHAWVLTDPDDPRLPTQLGRVELQGFADKYTVPDARDGLTREERVVLWVLHETQKERGGRNVPTAMLWGRVCEHFYISPEDLSAMLARLGARK
jgi:hypothetical protein